MPGSTMYFFILGFFRLYLWPHKSIWSGKTNTLNVKNLNNPNQTMISGCRDSPQQCLGHFHPGFSGCSDSGPTDPRCALQHLLCSMLTRPRVRLVAEPSFSSDCAQIHGQTRRTHHTALSGRFITQLQADPISSLSPLSPPA